MKYKWVKLDNGKYRIERVPVFKLGQIRGFLFDPAWAARMMIMMDTRANAGYYPPVIVGHNGFGSELKEKEAIGFMRNFSVEVTSDDVENPNGTIYCDLDELTEAAFEEIRALKYPYRSVELWYDRAEFSAVALLGGTEPYFKFPRLELSQDPEGEVFQFSDGDAGLALLETAGSENEQGKLRFSQTTTPEGTNTDGTRQRGEENTMNEQEFRAKYGMGFEEAGQLALEAGTLKAEVERLQAENLAAEKEKFAAEMRELVVAPALIQKFNAEVEKAADPKAAMASFKDIVSTAKSSGVFAELGESAQHGEKKPVTDPSDDNAVYDAVKRYQAEHKCSFEEAKKAVLLIIDEQNRKEQK